MVVELGVERPLRQTLLQLIDQTAAREDARLIPSRQKLIQYLIPDSAFPVRRHMLLLPSRASLNGSRTRNFDTLPGKTFETLDAGTLPAPLMRKLRELARDEFLERAENALAFGLPGVGKSHAACAIGNALIELGHSVLFRPAYQMVQELLAARRDLALPQKLRRLDTFELVILDDIGYVKQSPEEAEVAFTLIAERYERRSTLITSNLVFSEWERIFKDPMATAAAIDRLVHHTAILEFNVPSCRTRKPRRTDAGQPGEAVDASAG